MCLPEPIRNSRVAGLLEIRRDTAMMNKRAGEIRDSLFRKIVPPCRYLAINDTSYWQCVVLQLAGLKLGLAGIEFADLAKAPTTRLTSSTIHGASGVLLNNNYCQCVCVKRQSHLFSTTKGYWSP
jgi:hypothetical protein